MRRDKLPKNLKDLALDYAGKHRSGRDATNLANQTKTVLRNAVKAHWEKEKLPIGSLIRAGGLEFTYAATQSTVLDADAVLTMYDNEEIDRAQFLRMISIVTKEATNVLGGDQVAELTSTVTGDKVDIRVNSLPVENDDDEFIQVENRVKRKKLRRKFGKEVMPEVKTTKQRTKRKRKIKVQS